MNVIALTTKNMLLNHGISFRMGEGLGEISPNFPKNNLTTLFSCGIFRGLFLYLRVLSFEVVPHALLGEGFVPADFAKKLLMPQGWIYLFVRAAHLNMTSMA